LEDRITPYVAISVLPAMLPIGQLGVPYSAAYTATGGTAPYTFTADMPYGLVLHPDGTVTGTPNGTGDTPLNVHVTDAVGSYTDFGTDIAVQVNPPVQPPPPPDDQSPLLFNGPIHVSPPMLPIGQLGVPYSAAYTATGGTAPYTFTTRASTMPYGLVLHPDGTVTGTPNGLGDTPIIVHVTDAAGVASDFGTDVDVQVNPPVQSPPPPGNQPPLAFDGPIHVSPAMLAIGREGVPFTGTYTAVGGTPPYTFTTRAPAMPYGLVLHPDGTVTGTPNGSGDTPVPIHVTDADGNASDFGTDIDIQANSAGQPPQLSVSGSAAGTADTATLFNADGSTRFQVQPYGPDFTGGVRVAVGDVDGDGTPDLITAPGPGGGPDVRVFSGTDGRPLGDFMAFEPTFRGGMHVAAADMNGDGRAEIIASPDQTGGPRVRVLSGPDGGTVRADFFGIDSPDFRGGLQVAVGDVTGDGVPDLTVAAGSGGAPRVTVYDGAVVAASDGGAPDGGQVANFFAFEDTLRGGSSVAAGDLNGDGVADLAFGDGRGGGPRVRVIDGRGLLAAAGSFSALDQLPPQTQLANFFTGDAAARDGVRVMMRGLPGGASETLATEAGGGAVNLYEAKTLLADPSNPTPDQGMDPFNGAVVG
jgi:hypothetical protein